MQEVEARPLKPSAPTAMRSVHNCSDLEESPVKRSAPKPDLTIRQQQLMALVAKGLTNKEIASRLNLSEFTVRNHIHRVLKQLDAGSRSEAVEAIRAYGYAISS